MSLVISVPKQIYVYCPNVNYRIELELQEPFEGESPHRPGRNINYRCNEVQMQCSEQGWGSNFKARCRGDYIPVSFLRGRLSDTLQREEQV